MLTSSLPPRPTPKHNLWEAEGSCISDNTGLQRLSIDDEGVLHVRVFEEEEFRNIIASLKSEAVALNYSITSFAVSDFEIYLQPMFDILAPRFGNGLRELDCI